MRLLGLRNITCTKEDWHYLIFYDVDRKLEDNDLSRIDYIMKTYNISYLIYETKHGSHIIGLTPMDIITYAHVFDYLKSIFQEYYAGQTIRLSRKPDETQKFIRLENRSEIIPNLYNLYADRFNYQKLPWIRETSKYLLVFERYRSMKE